MTDLPGDPLELQGDTYRDEHLAFISEGLHYAVNAASVLEIITQYAVTRIPKVPDYLPGVFNLRGQIVPIIDLRLRMGRPPADDAETPCVVVLDIGGLPVGLRVEQVSHVVRIRREDIAPPPPNNRQAFISGLVNVDNTVYRMLDCERLAAV